MTQSFAFTHQIISACENHRPIFSEHWSENLLQTYIAYNFIQQIGNTERAYFASTLSLRFLFSLFPGCISFFTVWNNLAACWIYMANAFSYMSGFFHCFIPIGYVLVNIRYPVWIMDIHQWSHFPLHKTVYNFFSNIIAFIHMICKRRIGKNTVFMRICGVLPLLLCIIFSGD